MKVFEPRVKCEVVNETRATLRSTDSTRPRPAFALPPARMPVEETSRKGIEARQRRALTRQANAMLRQHFPAAKSPYDLVRRRLSWGMDAEGLKHLKQQMLEVLKARGASSALVSYFAAIADVHILKRAKDLPPKPLPKPEQPERPASSRLEGPVVDFMHPHNNPVDPYYVRMVASRRTVKNG